MYLSISLCLCEQYHLTYWWVFSSSYTGRLSDPCPDWSSKAEDTGQSLSQYLPGAAEYTTRRGTVCVFRQLDLQWTYSALEFTRAVMLPRDARVDWLINQSFCKATSWNQMKILFFVCLEMTTLSDFSLQGFRGLYRGYGSTVLREVGFPVHIKYWYSVIHIIIQMLWYWHLIWVPLKCMGACRWVYTVFFFWFFCKNTKKVQKFNMNIYSMF